MQEILLILPDINKNETGGICNHCLTKLSSDVICDRCRQISEKYATIQGIQYKIQPSERVQTKSEVDLQKLTLRPSLPKQDIDIQPLFHSDTKLDINIYEREELAKKVEQPLHKPSLKEEVEEEETYEPVGVGFVDKPHILESSESSESSTDDDEDDIDDVVAKEKQEKRRQKIINRRQRVKEKIVSQANSIAPPRARRHAMIMNRKALGGILKIAPEIVKPPAVDIKLPEKLFDFKLYQKDIPVPKPDDTKKFLEQRFKEVSKLDEKKSLYVPRGRQPLNKYGTGFQSDTKDIDKTATTLGTIKLEKIEKITKYHSALKGTPSSPSRLRVTKPVDEVKSVFQYQFKLPPKKDVLPQISSGRVFKDIRRKLEKQFKVSIKKQENIKKQALQSPDDRFETELKIIKVIDEEKEISEDEIFKDQVKRTKRLIRKKEQTGDKNLKNTVSENEDEGEEKLEKTETLTVIGKIEKQKSTALTEKTSKKQEKPSKYTIQEIDYESKEQQKKERKKSPLEKGSKKHEKKEDKILKGTIQENEGDSIERQIQSETNTLIAKVEKKKSPLEKGAKKHEKKGDKILKGTIQENEGDRIERQIKSETSTLIDKIKKKKSPLEKGSKKHEKKRDKILKGTIQENEGDRIERQIKSVTDTLMNKVEKKKSPLDITSKKHEKTLKGTIQEDDRIERQKKTETNLIIDTVENKKSPMEKTSKKQEKKEDKTLKEETEDNRKEMENKTETLTLIGEAESDQLLKEQKTKKDDKKEDKTLRGTIQDIEDDRKDRQIDKIDIGKLITQKSSKKRENEDKTLISTILENETLSLIDKVEKVKSSTRKKLKRRKKNSKLAKGDSLKSKYDKKPQSEIKSIAKNQPITLIGKPVDDDKKKEDKKRPKEDTTVLEEIQSKAKEELIVLDEQENDMTPKEVNITAQDDKKRQLEKIRDRFRDKRIETVKGKHGRKESKSMDLKQELLPVLSKAGILKDQQDLKKITKSLKDDTVWKKELLNLLLKPGIVKDKAHEKEMPKSSRGDIVSEEELLTKAESDKRIDTRKKVSISQKGEMISKDVDNQKSLKEDIPQIHAEQEAKEMSKLVKEHGKEKQKKDVSQTNQIEEVTLSPEESEENTYMVLNKPDGQKQIEELRFKSAAKEIRKIVRGKVKENKNDFRKVQPEEETIIEVPQEQDTDEYDEKKGQSPEQTVKHLIGVPQEPEYYKVDEKIVKAREETKTYIEEVAQEEEEDVDEITDQTMDGDSSVERNKKMRKFSKGILESTTTSQLLEHKRKRKKKSRYKIDPLLLKAFGIKNIKKQSDRSISKKRGRNTIKDRSEKSIFSESKLLDDKKKHESKILYKEKADNFAKQYQSEEKKFSERKIIDDKSKDKTDILTKEKASTSIKKHQSVKSIYSESKVFYNKKKDKSKTWIKEKAELLNSDEEEPIDESVLSVTSLLLKSPRKIYSQIKKVQTQKKTDREKRMIEIKDELMGKMNAKKLSLKIKKSYEQKQPQYSETLLPTEDEKITKLKKRKKKKTIKSALPHTKGTTVIMPPNKISSKRLKIEKTRKTDTTNDDDDDGGCPFFTGPYFMPPHAARHFQRLVQSNSLK